MRRHDAQASRNCSPNPIDLFDALSPLPTDLHVDRARRADPPIRPARPRHYRRTRGGARREVGTESRGGLATVSCSIQPNGDLILDSSSTRSTLAISPEET